ncbi:DUF4105 domain-containing protein, partial [Candidatus Roizmanbacteria bacterium]|nr:DUF4105 domain-containing protein [Candidatus Roizmanbacteria bacterium]
LTVETASRSKLLSHAVNYSAITTETFGPLFAVKGLFGFYKGYFSILPYYGKLQEYSDIDQRDIWEYPLDLTKEETLKLLMHVYELDSIYSDYYFFDENCSFMLLSLLEAARPELRLSGEYWGRWSFWVIPADTIGAVRRAGLIDKVNYRPSQATRISYRASLLSPGSRERAYDIAMLKRSTAAEVQDDHDQAANQTGCIAFEAEL